VIAAGAPIGLPERARDGREIARVGLARLRARRGRSTARVVVEGGGGPKSAEGMRAVLRGACPRCLEAGPAAVAARR
jgi:hypothetical protein